MAFPALCSQKQRLRKILLLFCSRSRGSRVIVIACSPSAKSPSCSAYPTRPSTKSYVACPAPHPDTDTAPSGGDRVWLLARLIEGAPPDVYLHPAHVRFANEKILVYEFENSQLTLTATSGAPVVKAQGKIVALNIGGGSGGGKLNAFGNPVVSVRKKVEATLLAAK